MPGDLADSLVGLREIARHPDLPLRVFEVSNPMPRAYVVGTWEEKPGANDALRRALEPDFAMSSSVVLEERPDHSPSPDAAGRIDEQSRSLHREDPRQLRVVVEVVTDLHADRPEPGLEHRKRITRCEAVGLERDAEVDLAVDGLDASLSNTMQGCVD